jgi:hypothetical protein
MQIILKFICLSLNKLEIFLVCNSTDTESVSVSIHDVLIICVYSKYIIKKKEHIIIQKRIDNINTYACILRIILHFDVR